MQMGGEQRIAAPRERVWAALNDPEILRQCIPGCQSLDKEGEDRFAAVAEVKIGPIGARFKGAVDLTELDPPNGYVLVGSGNGGIAGSAKGSAKVRLTEEAGATLLSYDVDAQVGGRMAQLGGPIIDATAKQLAGKFFTKFGEIVGEQSATQPPQPAATAPAVASGDAPAAPALAAAAPIAYAAPAVQTRASFPWAWAVAVALAVIGGFLLGRSPADDVWAVVMVILLVVTAGAGFEAGRRGGRS